MPESDRASPGPPCDVPDDGGSELAFVSHVTHIENALAILRDGRISARLVYDDSVLNTTRNHVVWLSPNDWSGAGGSRYGNVEFRFRWSDIVGSRQAWWVGLMPYRPPAARILITDRCPDSSLKLVPYDPTAPGPWRRRNGGDRWNHEICLEILAERDLPLDTVTELRCVDHHDRYCCIAPNGDCPEAGLSADRAARILIAAIVARDVPPQGLFAHEDGSATDLVETAWKFLWGLPRRSAPDPSGSIEHTAPEATSVAWAILRAFARSRNNDVAALCGLFRDRTNLREALAAVIEDHLDLQRGALGRCPDLHDFDAALDGAILAENSSTSTNT
jgi:hypothetical protein